LLPRQPTSVTGHRQRNTVNLELPVSENEDKNAPISDTILKKSLAAEMHRRAELLSREFDNVSFVFPLFSSAFSSLSMFLAEPFRRFKYFITGCSL
jgi:hypothetical protein